MDRRSFVQGIGAAAVPAALAGTAPAVAAATAADAPFDPYAAFLDVMRAWKRRDLEAVLAAMADDVVWYSFVGAPPLVGKPAVREKLGALASVRAEDRWRIFHHAVAGDRLLVEGVDDYVDAQGRRIATPYAGIVEYRGRLIVGWRDYFDLATLNAMKAGGGVPEAIRALVDRPGAP